MRTFFLLSILLILGGKLLASVSTGVSAIDSLTDEGNDFIWEYLHSSDSIVVTSGEIVSFLVANKWALPDGDNTDNDVDPVEYAQVEMLEAFEAAYFLARVNGFQLPEELIAFEKVAELTRIFGDEAAFALASQTNGRSPRLWKALGSDESNVRRVAATAIMIYGNERMRFELYRRMVELRQERNMREEYVKMRDEGQGYETAEMIRIDRDFYRSDIPQVYNLLSAYFSHTGIYGIMTIEEFIDRGGLPIIGSTVRSPALDKHGGHLLQGFYNIHYLIHLKRILDSAHGNERQELERRIRLANRSQTDGSRLRWSAIIYYLLGFELSAEERDTIVNYYSIEEDCFLDRGKIYFPGVDLQKVEISFDDDEIAVEFAELRANFTQALTDIRTGPNAAESRSGDAGPMPGSRYWLIVAAICITITALVICIKLYLRK